MATAREKVIQQAERYVSRGKVEAAIREYRKVLAENPRDTNTLNRVGDLYARLERNGEAIQLFTKIAETYTEDGFFVKAIAIYKKIIKLDPTRLDIYEKLAELYHRQGLVNEARTQYQVLADYYQKHDQIEAATGICRRMVVLEPANPSHRAKLADLLEQQGKGAEAIEQYAAIGDQMLSASQVDGAVRVYEKALNVEAELGEFLFRALAQLRSAGQADAAERLRAQALKRKPELEAELAERERSRPSDRDATARKTGKELKLIQPKPIVAAAATAPPAAEAPPSPPPRASTPPPAMVTPAFAAKPDPDEIELFLDETEDEPAASVKPPAAAEGLPAVEFDLSLEDEVFVFDLEDDTPPASQVSPPPDMAARPPRPPSQIPAADEVLAGSAESEAAAFTAGSAESGRFSEFDFGPAVADDDGFEEPGGLDLDSDFLERTAAEVEPGRLRQEEDLFTEAEVLAKYGLREKALERLEELFRTNPNHLGAYALQIGLYLELGRHERVVILANEMSGIASELGQNERWQEVRERLLASGYQLEGLRVVAAPAGVRLPIAQPTAEQLFDGFDEEVEPVAAPPLAFSEPLLPVEADELPEPEPTPEPAASGFLADLDLEVEESIEAVEPVEALPTLDLPPLDPPAVLPRAPELIRVPSLVVPVLEERPAPTVPAPAAAPRKRPRLGDIDAQLAELAGVVKTKSPSAPAVSKPARAAASVAVPPPLVAPPPRAALTPMAAPPPAVEMAATELFDLRSIGADIEAEAKLVGLPALQGAAMGWDPSPAPPSPPARGLNLGAPLVEEFEVFAPSGTFVSPPPPVSEASVSWLDEVTPEATTGAGDADKLFEDEEGFFDLAAELEEELRKEEGGDAESLFAQPHEQSLEEIVEGFKRGVAEHLSPEDYETHFNLGIAYREMGLLDEAIGEFQLAAKNPARLVDCCSMLGLSFLDKGLPELAVKWYRRGLAAPGLTENDQLGLLYELGIAFLAMNDRENAHKSFVEIYGINTNYRDVVARLQELGRPASAS